MKEPWIRVSFWILGVATHTKFVISAESDDDHLKDFINQTRRTGMVLKPYLC
jgi:hypothetical protein